MRIILFVTLFTTPAFAYDTLISTTSYPAGANCFELGKETGDFDRGVSGIIRTGNSLIGSGRIVCSLPLPGAEGHLIDNFDVSVTYTDQLGLGHISCVVHVFDRGEAPALTVFPEPAQPFGVVYSQAWYIKLPKSLIPSAAIMECKLPQSNAREKEYVKVLRYTVRTWDLDN